MRLQIALGCGIVLAASAVRAGGEEPPPAGEGEHEHHHAHEHHHENHVAVFVGSTHGTSDEATSHLTLGADYERRLTFIDHRVGAGALVDTAFGEEKETLLAGFVAVHPVRGLMLLAGVGAAVTSNDRAFAVRGSAAYFIPAGMFSAGPVISVDHANGETAVVYGASFGAGF